MVTLTLLFKLSGHMLTLIMVPLEVHFILHSKKSFSYPFSYPFGLGVRLGRYLPSEPDLSYAAYFLVLLLLALEIRRSR